MYLTLWIAAPQPSRRFRTLALTNLRQSTPANCPSLQKRRDTLQKRDRHLNDVPILALTLIATEPVLFMQLFIEQLFLRCIL
jgi:hypothetical protein